MSIEAFIALIALVISVILAICKLTFWTSLTWFWVLVVPLIIVGVICFSLCG